MTLWQTIESAPKDGTYVILFARGEQFIGSFRTRRSVHHRDAWCVDADSDFHEWDGYPPTHWMPLPPPPSA